MISGKAVYHILIISGTQKGASFITEMLDSSMYCTHETVSNGSEARRHIMENDYDIVIINTPLGDEFGHELAAAVAEKGTGGVILIVKNELYEELSMRLEDCGIMTMAKPLSKQLFYQGLKLVIAGSNRCRQLETENRRLQQKLKELMTVSRAKCALIEFAHMTEEQAHKYIEKQAMDSRSTRLEVAGEILRTYTDVM